MDNEAHRATATLTIRLTDEVTVGPFLKHALVATFGAAVLPIVAVVAAMYVLDPAPSPVAIGLLGIGVAVIATFIGATLWQHVDESDAIEFGELMLWSWMRRHRAEQLVGRHTAELGLDVHGRSTAVIPRATRLELLKELTAALQEKDSYTRGHSKRVERLTYKTALAMGLSSREVKVARTAASVHDVGKVSVPDEILRKPTTLSELEFETMKEHAARGARMVESVGDARVTAAVRHHHERWDGRGYPDGLVAHETPLVARIISVADTFDALTSTRTYRAKRSRRTALQVIEGEKGKQLDPEVVTAFLGTMRERPVYYVPALLSLLSHDSFAAVASWGKRRSSALAAAALVLVAAVASGAMFAEDEVPVTTVAAPADAGGTETGGGSRQETGNADGSAEDRASRGDAPTVTVDNPPTNEDTVLGTRIETAGSDGRRDRGAGRRRERDMGALDRAAQPKRPEPTPDEVGVGRDRAPDPPGLGKDKPGRARAERAGSGRDPAPGHGKDCEGNPGRGHGGGRQHHC